MFDLHILKNDSHYLNNSKEPPGMSILDPMQVLIYYVYALFEIKASDQIEELFV
jgi:hypothetical protein